MSQSPIVVTDDNPGASVQSFLYVPDSLIADPTRIVTQPIVVGAGTYKRGQVLGLSQVQPIDGKAAAANKGNGTLTGLVTLSAFTGNYVLTATSDTEFSVVNPEGESLGTATVGTAFASDEIGFLLTAGSTAFVAGDVFAVTVFDALAVFVASVPTANDGSQVPSAILAEDVTTTQDVTTGAYVAGEFNLGSLVYDKSWSPAALSNALRVYGIHTRRAVGAAPPSNNSAP
ncbi:hypothetical protein JET76_23060 [Pseudomonas putida]|uniref:hypothetical protein n=1 Tax=Pseudomonas putida TaxID=303 RepID=UPI0018E6CE55|nr:hypothetical protein [Pseudomonas putida]MBI6944209.1 hypothetical protein [Pseudomonas putida]MBI6960310.1 hypothetical protein [Pseudomonas putida]